MSSEKKSPLDPHQHRFLARLAQRGSNYVVTGPKALQLHAYAADVAVPEWFSPRRFPALDLALEPGEAGLEIIRVMVNQNLIVPVGPPISTGKPASETVPQVVVLKPLDPADPVARLMRSLSPGFIRSMSPDLARELPGIIQSLSPAAISYGTTGIDDYPQNPTDDRRVVIDGLAVPVCRMFETAAATQRKLKGMTETGQIGVHGQFLLDDMMRLVKRINQKHDTRPVPPRGRQPFQPPRPPMPEGPPRSSGDGPRPA